MFGKTGVEEDVHGGEGGSVGKGAKVAIYQDGYPQNISGSR